MRKLYRAEAFLAGRLYWTGWVSALSVERACWDAQNAFARVPGIEVRVWLSSFTEYAEEKR